MATRLSLVALVVTFVSLAVTATVGLVRGSQLADELADDRLITVVASRANEIEVDMAAIGREITALASSPATRDTISELGDAALALADEPVDTDATDALTEYYLAEVVPELEDVRGTRVGASFLVPDARTAVYLQSAYTVPQGQQDDAGGDSGDAQLVIAPELVLDPGDGSEYSVLHPAVHQTWAEIAIQSGFDDLFLIDARRDLIAYSVRKRIDFGTSLDVGPYSGSALARLIDDIADDPNPTARLSDFSAYVPVGERPTAFVASPVFDGDTVVGYVAAELAVDHFDSILSGEGSWRHLGDTGEVYLVGPDGLMRSTSRSYQDRPAGYLAAASQPGPAELPDADRRRIKATDTTALVQPVDHRMVGDAGPSTTIVDNVSYQGEDVRAAYRRLDLDGVEWTIVGEVARAELDVPIKDYALDMLFAVALFIVIVTFVAVRWSDRVMAPVRAIATRLRSVRDGNDQPGDSQRTGDQLGPTEYAELSENVDQMLTRLRDRQTAVEARSNERMSLLRQFLPATIARRSEEGDGEVLDHVDNASVVVLTVDGLGELVGERPDQEVRDLLADIVDEIDALAADFGLERIKLTGSAYYAVCGVSRPYLDHAPRSVGFGLAARDLVDELAADRLRVRGAVAAGSVSVGLASRAALVYDVWGDTVTTAEELARGAQPGSIMVSTAVRRQLPEEFVVTGDADGVAAVTGRVHESETTG